MELTVSSLHIGFKASRMLSDSLVKLNQKLTLKSVEHSLVLLDLAV